MRIRSKVGLVGGIPIAIGAAIAVVAWFLLAEAERTRGGAVLAGAVYRDLLSVMRARDDYVGATPAARERFATAFSMVSDSARATRPLGAVRARSRRARNDGASPGGFDAPSRPDGVAQRHHHAKRPPGHGYERSGRRADFIDRQGS
jgi:hypothetical protein